jgi:hypothetical protein
VESVDTSGKSLIEHWRWASDKGVMNPNTASAFRAACAQVLSVAEGWESLDVRTIDVDDICRRFQNKRSKDFKPESLDAYKRRFGQAVTLFLKYANDPSSWKAPSQERASRKERRNTSLNNGDPTLAPLERTAPPSIASGLVEYPFPLREGRLAYLKLPVDLKVVEVKRLTAYLNTLAVDTATD